MMSQRKYPFEVLFCKVILQIAIFGGGLCVCFSAMANTVSGSRPQCQSSQKNKTVSINVGFSYRRTPRMALPGARGDLKFFNRMSQEYSDRQISINDEQSSAQSKELFLRRLRESVAQAETVNFNFAGHGVWLNGEWALQLPGQLGECQERVGQMNAMTGNSRSVTKPKPPSPGSQLVFPESGDAEVSREQPQGPPAPLGACSRFFVTASELRNVFSNRRVFGFVDSCYSGYLNLGPNAAMVTGASPVAATLTHLNSGRVLRQAQTTDMDNQENGSFTRMLMNAFKKACVDDNSDGKTSLLELINNTPSHIGNHMVDFAGQDAAHNPRTESQVSNIQELQTLKGHTPRATGAPAWADCIPLGPSPSNCSQREGLRPGQSVVTSRGTLARQNMSDSRGACHIPPGTRVEVVQTTLNPQFTRVLLPQGVCERLSREVNVETRALQNSSGQQLPASGSPESQQ